MHWIDWCITIIPFVIIMAMAIYSGKYVRGVADFLAAGRVAGRYVISVGDVAAGLSVITLVGAVEQNYQIGYALGFWNIIGVPAGLFISLTGFCLYRYRATRALSFGQFLEMRYCKSLRYVAAFIRNIAEMVTNALGPAIAAAFFIYFLGLPQHFSFLGLTISTSTVVIAVCLLFAMICIWPGGRVSLLVTDTAQGVLSYPIFVIVTIYALSHFSWSREIAPVMMDRMPGESFLDPFDISKLRDFNIFATIVTLINGIWGRAAWVGNDTTNSGRTPHENKMAGILGTWRNGFSGIMLLVLAIIIFAFMNHKNFAGGENGSHRMRQLLSDRLTNEMFEDESIRAKDNPELSLREAIDRDIYSVPIVYNEIGGEGSDRVFTRDNPNGKLSRDSNIDTAFEIMFRESLDKHAPDSFSDGYKTELQQKYKIGFGQKMTPMALRTIFPPGICGLFCLLMLMLLISTDDSRIFNASSTWVQDCILPFVKKQWTTKQHIAWLRWASVGVALFFFVVAVFFKNIDYINMFVTIMCAVWVAASGPIMIGGLYSTFGNSCGAYCSLIFGSGFAAGCLLMQMNWAKYVYPWLENLGWVEPLDRFLRGCTTWSDPWVVWSMNPQKFPISSPEVNAIAMVLSLLGYIGGTAVTYKGPYNLDRLLHRGKYAVEGSWIKEKWTLRNVFQKLIGIDAEYTRGDKIIAWSVFLWTFVYQIGLCFVLPLVWNLISRWPIEWWSWYFFITSICVSVAVGIVSTVWFMWGGIKDTRALFRDLAARVDNRLDNGMVADGVALADIAHDSQVDTECGDRTE